MPGLPLLLILIGLALRFLTHFHTLGEVLIGLGIALSLFIILFMVAAFGTIAAVLSKKGTFK